MPNPLDPYAFQQPTPFYESESQPADGEPVPPPPEPRRPTFSLFRMSRNDPAEKALLAMLLNADPTLPGEKPDKPVAFAVFGLGRVLPALVGKGIDPDNILMVCDFVSGPCACNLKVQCPGMDLLIATDWSAPPPEPAAAATMPSAAGAACRPAGGGLLRNIAVAGGILILSAGLAVLLVRRQTSRS